MWKRIDRPKWQFIFLILAVSLITSCGNNGFVSAPDNIGEKMVQARPVVNPDWLIVGRLQRDLQQSAFKVKEGEKIFVVDRYDFSTSPKFPFPFAVEATDVNSRIVTIRLSISALEIEVVSGEALILNTKTNEIAYVGQEISPERLGERVAGVHVSSEGKLLLVKSSALSMPRGPETCCKRQSAAQDRDATMYGKENSVVPPNRIWPSGAVTVGSSAFTKALPFYCRFLTSPEQSKNNTRMPTEDHRDLYVEGNVYIWGAQPLDAENVECAATTSGVGPVPIATQRSSDQLSPYFGRIFYAHSRIDNRQGNTIFRKYGPAYFAMSPESASEMTNYLRNLEMIYSTAQNPDDSLSEWDDNYSTAAEAAEARAAQCKRHCPNCTC